MHPVDDFFFVDDFSPYISPSPDEGRHFHRSQARLRLTPAASRVTFCAGGAQSEGDRSAERHPEYFQKVRALGANTPGQDDASGSGPRAVGKRWCFTFQVAVARADAGVKGGGGHPSALPPAPLRGVVGKPPEKRPSGPSSSGTASRKPRSGTSRKWLQSSRSPKPASPHAASTSCRCTEILYHSIN